MGCLFSCLRLRFVTPLLCEQHLLRWLGRCILLCSTSRSCRPRQSTRWSWSCSASGASEITRQPIPTKALRLEVSHTIGLHSPGSSPHCARPHHRLQPELLVIWPCWKDFFHLRCLWRLVDLNADNLAKVYVTVANLQTSSLQAIITANPLLNSSL